MFFRLFCGFSLLLVVATISGTPPMAAGEEATTLQFPYQVSLEVKGEHFCGGSIIHKRFILTAAHCVYYLKSYVIFLQDLLGIRVGSDSAGAGGVVYEVEKTIPNWRYDFETGQDQFDIGLVMTKKDIEFTDRIKPIKLVEETVPAGAIANISGYAPPFIKNESEEGHLIAVQFPVIPFDVCKNRIKQLQLDKICTKAPEGQDTCVDNGGPLAFNDKLAGISAWNEGCADEKTNFSVFTNVTVYKQWIEKVIKEELNRTTTA